MTDAPIFILAGEPSGDQLAAHMRALTARFGPIDWVGVGGLHVQQGLTTLIDMDALTILALGEPLVHI